MDPGPYEISLYLAGGRADLGDSFNGLAFLVCAKYVEAARLKGWRMTKRLVIHIGSDSDPVIRKKGGIISLHCRFSPAEYLGSTEEVREQIVLDIIHQCVTRCCASTLDWPYTAFEQAYFKVKAHKGDLVREAQLIRSPDRKHYAAVVVVTGVRYATIYARFFDQRRTVLRDVELIKTFQSPLFYSQILTRMEWKDSSTFAIGNETKELGIEATLTAKTATVRLEPKKRTVEELQGLLRMCTYREFASDAERVAWVNQ